MSYSRYFGMRSFENVVRNARFRAPKTGTPMKIGSPVTVDPANAGLMKQSGAGDKPTASSGLVIFEHIQNKSDLLTTVHDSPYDQVPLGQYAQIMRGPGAKVWFKNNADKVLYDGRVQAAGGLLDAAAFDGSGVVTLAVGDGLIPAAGGKFAKAGATDAAWLVVEQVNPSTGLVEARLTF